MQPTGLLKVLVVSLDAAGVAAGLAVAHQLWIWRRPRLEFIAHIGWLDLWVNNPFMPPAIVLLLVWVLALRASGLYDPGLMTSSARIASGITRSSLIVPVVAMILQFLMPDRTYSRFLILSFCASTALILMVLRLGFFRVQRHIPRPIIQQRVAIVGVGEDARQMAERLRAFGHHAYPVVGFIRPAQAEAGDPAVGADAVLGPVEALAELVNRHNLQVLVLATGAINRDEALLIATRADQMGLRMLQVPFSWGAVSSLRVQVAELGDLQLIDLTGLAYPTRAEQVKRAIDLVLVGVGGLLLLPFLLCVALAVKLQDGGPVLFVNPRAGKGGRNFPFFKFRSMVVGAELQRDQLKDQNEADGALFKIRDDPRVTPLGRLLRKYSIDELPQLWNVLRGDMNLVGPRPLPLGDIDSIEQDAEIRYWFELRSKVKPGITGPWQVGGRSDAGFHQMMQHDIWYIQGWSVWLDLVILLRTVPAVLRGRGAR